MMKPIDVFRKYVAIKVHFTSDKFDYTESRGYTKNITENAFYKRNDRYYFEKIANKLKDDEIVPFFVSNFIEDCNMWSGDLASFNRSYMNYKSWKARLSNLKIEVREDINNIGHFLKDNDLEFEDILKEREGELPIVVKMYLQKVILKETFVYIVQQKCPFNNIEQDKKLNKQLTIMDYFDIICKDPLWKAESKIIRKYSKFLKDINWKEILYSN